MSPSETEKCLSHPKFKQLTHTRGRFGVIFSLIIMVGFGFYVLATAYAPEFMANPLYEGESITYGILMAVFMILLGMVTSGIYTWWANRYFDVLRDELLKELGHE